MFEMYFTMDDTDNAAHTQISVQSMFMGEDPAVTYNTTTYSFENDSITKNSGQILPVE